MEFKILAIVFKLASTIREMIFCHCVMPAFIRVILVQYSYLVQCYHTHMLPAHFHIIHGNLTINFFFIFKKKILSVSMKLCYVHYVNGLSHHN